MMLRRLLSLLFLALAMTPALAAGDITKESLAFNGRDRTYYLYAPPAPAPAPLVLLLHGSGSRGIFMAKIWKDLATREGIVLVAPDSLHPDIGWDLRVDGPDYIRAVLAAVTATHSIDPHRLYVFGQSGGAVYTLQLGMLESEFFAAVAVHAGAWRHPEEYKVAGYATRKIPVSISVGDLDEYFPMDSVRNTQHILTLAGFPIEVNVLPGRHHAYADVPADFNDTVVWAFFRRTTLTGDPKYADYTYRADMR